MDFYNILAASFCQENDIKRLFSFVGQLFNILKVVIPVILILMGSIDLVKAIVSNNDNMKKAQATLIKRFIIGAVIFFVPTLVTFVMNLVGTKMDNPCISCFFNPTDKSQCYFTTKKEQKTDENGNTKIDLEELEYSTELEKITNSAER